MIRTITTALAGLAALGASAFAQDEAPAEAASETAPSALVLDWPAPAAPVDVICPFDFDYEPGALSCGFITVPENRSDPDSRMIRLHYVKIASTAEDESEIRPDPVIYLTGGPGVVVEGYADRLREHHILEQRDLYILEQRGIANSGDFCPYYEATHRDLAWGETRLDEAINQAERMRECFRAASAAGVDVSGYSTWENAHDLRDLRQALGFESWNAWGISYGSHLGQMLMQVDPGGTRAIVIDAIVPNDLEDLMRLGRWVNRVFDNVFTTCADDPVCDGLRPRLDAAMAQLSENPIVIETDNPEVYPAGQVRFGAEILLFAPFMMMYEQDEHPAIPAVIDSLVTAVETGDTTVFELLATSGFNNGSGSSQGMSSAIRCNDGYYAAQAEVIGEDLAENPVFLNLGFSEEGSIYQAQVCEEEGLMPRRGTAEYQLVDTELPVLVINGAWDPVTPPPLAQRVAANLSNARYIEVPYSGHGPTRSLSECAGPVLNAFFDNPDPAALDASCLEEGVAEPSYITVFSTGAILRAGLMAEDDPKTLAPAILWFGLPTFILLISFFAYPFGLFARLIDGQPVQMLGGETGGARALAYLASILGLAFPVMLGIGGYELSEISQVAMLAGLSETAALGAWAGLVAGLAGLAALLILWRTQFTDGRIRIGTLLGITLTGGAAVALAAFGLAWDLAPF